MKKLAILMFVFLISVVIWYGESRSFYCLDNGSCITVWKTYDDVCYIIPGKYYGMVRPKKNFIESTNNNNLTIYFTSELPNAFIFKSEQGLKINNSIKSEFTFYDYNRNSTKFDKILYKPNAKKNNDIKPNARLMDLFILENFALDMNGKKL